MRFRLLALDIDGTLLDPRGEITPPTRAALNEARARGVRIALVTGRRFGSARPLVRELELEVPLVSHNGALTKNVETLETYGFHPLEAATARDLIRLARRRGFDTICCDDPEGTGLLVTEGISAGNRPLERYLEKYRDAVREVPDLIDYLDHAPIQIMFSGRCDPVEVFAAELEAELEGRAQLFRTRYRSHDLTILDALSPTASKGAGLDAVARAYAVAPAEILAIGDNHNDLTMLRHAGLGVVMANAEDELKTMGFALTSSNAEDGVARAIERYILEAGD
jgi:Cof subfamily protein (haloacid dehalogenase superfamily)